MVVETEGFPAGARATATPPPPSLHTRNSKTLPSYQDALHSIKTRFTSEPGAGVGVGGAENTGVVTDPTESDSEAQTGTHTTPHAHHHH